jgi:hypothetical protein
VVLVLQCLDLFICAVSYGRNGALTVTPVLLFCRCSTSIESSVDALEQLLQTTTTELTTELVVASRAAEIMLLQQAAEVRDVVEDYLETVSRAPAAASRCGLGLLPQHGSTGHPMCLHSQCRVHAQTPPRRRSSSGRRRSRRESSRSPTSPVRFAHSRVALLTASARPLILTRWMLDPCRGAWHAAERLHNVGM